MKTIIYSLIAVIVFGIVASGFKTKTIQKNSILVQCVDKSISSSLFSQSAAVISNRLKDFCPGFFELRSIPEKRQIEVQFANVSDTRTIENLILNKGKLAFYENVNHKEIPAGENQPILTSADIANIKFSKDETSDNCSLEISFKESAIGIWSEASKRNLNKEIAIVIDNKVIYSPVMKTGFENGVCSIAGRLSLSEVKYFAAIGNNGELPVNLEIVK